MSYPYHKITREDEAALRALISDKNRVFTGVDITDDYYHDEMPEYGIYPPDMLIEASCKEEVSAVMRYANEHNIPVVVRGAGTGLAGGSNCKYGGIMLSLRRMNRLITIDKGNMSMTVQPGLLLSEVVAAAAAEGFYYPPDPGEKSATIGGNVITNAGGMKAVKYGLTRDFVRCLEVVLPDGEIVNMSSNVVKNTTGYDLKDLIIGSEGTLGIVTEITLKLLPYPKCSQTLVIPFASLESCIDMVPVLLRMPNIPVAIEFLERELIDIVERNLDKKLPVTEGEAVLIVMYDGSTMDAVDEACAIAAEAAEAAGALDVFLADTKQRSEQIWSVRGSILEGMKAESVAQEECDVVVPRARIAEYVRIAKNIGSKYGIRVEPCGHAGDGNIHTEMLRMEGMSDEDWKNGTRNCLKELYAVSKQFGGQLSGEHGIGNGRLEYLKPFVGDRTYRLYQAVKLAFDPNQVLNPGKMIVFEGQPDAKEILK